MITTGRNTGEKQSKLVIGIMTDPGNAEAYRALAELYVLTEDYESAVAVLNQGIGQTGSYELSEYIEKVQEAYEGQKALEEELAMENPQEPAGGNVTRAETVYNEDGTYYIYEYDGNGTLVKVTGYNADGSIRQVYEY